MVCMNKKGKPIMKENKPKDNSATFQTIKLIIRNNNPMPRNMSKGPAFFLTLAFLLLVFLLATAFLLLFFFFAIAFIVRF